MYAALWRVLPGPWWVRVLILLVLFAAVIFVLFEWVFPWVDALLNRSDQGTVGALLAPHAGDVNPV